MQKILLCIIGSPDIVERIIEKINPDILENIEVKTIIINHVEESLLLENELLKEYDILFFAGHLAYDNFIRNCYLNGANIDPLPIVIRYEGSILYKALFELAMTTKGSIEKFTPFSVDFLFEKEVQNTLNELGFTQNDFIIAQGESNFTTDEWADLHEKYYTTGQSNYAVTCLKSVADELKRRNIPVKRVEPTNSSIENALELLYSKCENLLKEGSKTTAIFIKWQAADRRPKNRYHYHRQILEFQKLIVDFCEEIQASLSFLNENQVNIFTNESILKDITSDFYGFPLLKQLENKTGNKIYVGIGIAEEVSQAELNAEKSLKFAESNKDSNAYIVFSNGDIIGPLRNTEKIPLVFSSSLEDKELIEIAKKTSLSPVTIHKLLSMHKQTETDHITTHQLASIFDISLRSASRILKTLEEHNLAEIIGEEQPAGRGRPRKVYKILLSTKISL